MALAGPTAYHPTIRQRKPLFTTRQHAYMYTGILPIMEGLMSSLAETVAHKLGGRSVLGHQIRSQADLAAAVHKRLPVDALEGLASAGISDAEIALFVIPHRTRRHRIQKQERLTVDESDKAVRLLRIQSLAEDAFGDVQKANIWLRRPLRELSGQTPIATAQTETGARVVETILAKIAWGAPA